MTHSIKTIMTAPLCCALLAALTCLPAAAQESQYKIGVVDMQTVLAQYEKRKAKYEELQGQVDALQAEIDAMSAQIEAAKNDYERRRSEMSEAEMRELEAKIKADYSDYQNELNKSQQRIDSMEEQVLNEVLKDVKAAIDVVAENGNYHLILNNVSGPRGAVLYAHNSIDITSRILEHLNK